MDQPEKNVWILEGRTFAMIQSEKNKDKDCKRVKKAHMIYDIPSKETICIVLES